MVKVKICGITTLTDAIAATDSGADALGFVFYTKSPRYITPDKAREIIQKLPPFITTVGVFVDEKAEEIERVAQYALLNTAQLHGNESPDSCRLIKNIKVIKAVRVRELNDLAPLETYQVSAFLLDTFAQEAPGGTGQVFNWDIATAARQFGKIILAGGLNPDNVQKAVRLVNPYAVDVSSGVESEKGKKDHTKIRAFIEIAKKA